MADRYLRASGNWNGPVWAATWDGVAGSASTPTVNDDVFFASNREVTLTGDAECRSMPLGGGPPPISPMDYVNINGHKLHVHGDVGPVAVFGGGGSLVVDGWLGTAQEFLSEFNIDTVIVNVSQNTFFDARDYTYHDVIVNMGANTSSSTTLNITGSPTFRSLIIQSKNSAAHTVNLDDGGSISLEKLVIIGSSSTNKLTLSSPNFANIVPRAAGATSYGQFVHVDNVYADGWISGEDGPKYIGSNSTQSGNEGWLLQDPPKISTLVDPLTTAPGSNPNWTSTGYDLFLTTGGYYGGGYTLPNDDSGTRMLSTDTYDFVDSSLVFEISTIVQSGLAFDTDVASHTLQRDSFYRLSVSSSGSYLLERSGDGSVWSVESTMTVDPVMYRSARVVFRNTYPGIPGGSVVGSINPSLTPSAATGNFFHFF